MEEKISLIKLFKILKKKINIIISLTLLGFVISFLVTFFLITPKYRSSTQLLVNRNQATEEIQRSDIDTNLELIETYKDIIKSPAILDDVREELNLNLSHNDLIRKINISSKSRSQVFSIEVTDEDPELSSKIVNTIAETFQKNINEIMNVDNVSIISKGIVNSNPISPNKIMNLTIGALLGLIVGIGLSIILNYIDQTVNDKRFVTDQIGWKNLGEINIMSKEQLQLSETIGNRKKNL